MPFLKNIGENDRGINMTETKKYRVEVLAKIVIDDIEAETDTEACSIASGKVLNTAENIGDVYIQKTEADETE
jgi:hypothetical protein